jgi:hypothetical protein
MRIYAGLLIFAGWIGCGTAVFALETMPARSYTKLTADGRHRLVMIVPKAVRDHSQDPVRAEFDRSGLYPLNSHQPCWTCEWFAHYESGVITANDGEFVVRVPDRKRNWRQYTGGPIRIPPRPPGIEQLAAIIVYQNGVRTRTYRLAELFDCTRFTALDCDGGPECTIERFSNATGRVTIRTTADGTMMKRTLDYRTGEIFPHNTPDAPEDPAVVLAAVVEQPEVVQPNLVRTHRTARLILMGIVVVAGSTLAFLTLGFILIRGQQIVSAPSAPPKLIA